jgi:RNA polymerase sigma factor (sigma-70 family)
MMTKTHRQARGGAAGVYLEGVRVSTRPDGPLLAREEQQLVEGLLAGNEDAVRALYARYARPIFTLGLRLLGSAEAAEELTQDVFLAAWRKAARFDPARGRLSTWLMTIAHNLAVDRLRRETGVTRPHLVLVDEVPELEWVDEEEPLIERDAAIRALESLSDAEKRLLARAYFGGLTAREIAEADGDYHINVRVDPEYEALLNAARHSGDSGPIRVYAEIDDAGIALFVRDRGSGFDPGTVPSDRRGVRESIVGRMERAGGRADIRSSPGGGTEVAIEIARSDAATREPT